MTKICDGKVILLLGLLLLGRVLCAETITIIVPAYNSETFIHDAILSVLDQTHEDWNLIVVDDGSTDDTANIVREYALQDERIQLIQHPQNMGIGPARNTALAISDTRYVAFLDSDDIWAPRKLERQLAFMQEHNIAFSSTSYRWLSEDGKFMSNVFHVPKVRTYRQLLKHNAISIFLVMLDRHQIESKIGEVRFENAYDEDLLLYLNLTKHGFHAYGLDEDLGWNRAVGSSFSANKVHAARQFWGILRQHEGGSLVPSVVRFGHYAARTSWKHAVQYRLKRPANHDPGFAAIQRGCAAAVIRRGRFGRKTRHPEAARDYIPTEPL